MKPIVSIAGLLLFLSSLAAPLWAHGVFVPLPRNPSQGALEYKVKILATNQGNQTRRFQVAEVVPEPSEPPSEELLADLAVPARKVGVFEMLATENASGLLRVTGAPQMVIGAVLEVRENGELIDTVSLPGVTAPEEDDHQESGILRHSGSLDHHAQVQGLALAADGSVSTDLVLLNLDEEERAECAIEFFTAEGQSLARLAEIVGPIGAATSLDRVFEAVLLPENRRDLENIRAKVDCADGTFYTWAAVYRNGGRDVVFLTPSVSTK